MLCSEFKTFLLVLTKFAFWQEDWALTRLLFYEVLRLCFKNFLIYTSVYHDYK